jgi:regulatory protein YycI of two-component signal transduction system YycFG
MNPMAKGADIARTTFFFSSILPLDAENLLFPIWIYEMKYSGDQQSWRITGVFSAVFASGCVMNRWTERPSDL